MNWYLEVLKKYCGILRACSAQRILDVFSH